MPNKAKKLISDTKTNISRIVIVVEKETHHELKMAALRRQMTLKDFMLSAALKEAGK